MPRISKHLIANEDVPLEKSQELFRTLHTLKGLSQMANLTEMVAMAHAVEDYIEFVRSEKVKLTKEIIELVSDAQNVFEQVYKAYPNPIDPDVLMEADRLVHEFHAKSDIVKSGGHPHLRLLPQEQKTMQHRKEQMVPLKYQQKKMRHSRNL